MPDDAQALEERLTPFIADPRHAALLFDVDGVLAPIVNQPEDAHVHEATRRPLIEVAKRYGVVACVSGRRASDARRIVALGTIAYLGSHGSEVLRPGATEPVLDAQLESWAKRVQAFAGDHFDENLRKLRVRAENKEVIAALHWRGATDEDEAQAAVEKVADAAQEAGFNTHWGRKVLEIRPPVRIDKGRGVTELLRDKDVTAALYAGDDTTDLDAFRALGVLRDEGKLQTALRVGVRSPEQPSALEREADVMVDGTTGVRDMLAALLR